MAAICLIVQTKNGVRVLHHVVFQACMLPRCHQMPDTIRYQSHTTTAPQYKKTTKKNERTAIYIHEMAVTGGVLLAGPKPRPICGVGRRVRFGQLKICPSSSPSIADFSNRCGLLYRTSKPHGAVFSLNQPTHPLSGERSLTPSAHNPKHSKRIRSTFP